MTDLTPIIEIIVALIGAVLAAFVIPWLRTKLTAEDTKELLTWVQIAVSAAQQLYHQLDGSKRLEYALSILEQKGFDIESDVVISAVEAEVLKLHQELLIDVALEGTSV